MYVGPCALVASRLSPSDPTLSTTTATNKTRIVKKVVPNDSFFNFFSPPSPPSIEALEAGDIDEEELEILDEKLELDYQVGEDLKERVVPKAIDFFTGKVLEYEGDDSEEGDFADGGDFSVGPFST